MKREIQDESFEEFLKRNADNLRMKAPDKIWQNLSAELNKRRRRVGAGLSAFLLTTSILAYLTISNTSKQFLTPVNRAQTTQSTTASAAQEKTHQAKKHLALGEASLAQQKSNRSQISTALTGSALAGSSLGVDFLTGSALQQPADGNSTAQTNSFTPTVVDDSPDWQNNSHKAEEKQLLKPSFLSTYDAAPLSIESVVNTYHKKKSRFQTQVYFTPTISYRKLSENKSYLRTAAANANTSLSYNSLYSSVNNMVTHKPDIGFELGITEKFSLTKKLRIRAGLQFNVNRYDIKAFKAPFALATIALNNRGSSRLDTVYRLSNYSNVNGASNKSSWLQNLSFQVSAPVGFELALKGTEKMEFGIAGTVQPTYVLGDRAYLITTDYKSYTQVPWLLRRWNVNTAFETFVAYQAGKTRWQVGPQVRYQLLSSFISNYPVKENLFDFGLKIGVSLNK